MTEPQKKKHHGKQTKQRMKPYIVLQYLLRNTDAEHLFSLSARKILLNLTLSVDPC